METRSPLLGFLSQLLSMNNASDMGQILRKPGARLATCPIPANIVIRLILRFYWLTEVVSRWDLFLPWLDAHSDDKKGKFEETGST